MKIIKKTNEQNYCIQKIFDKYFLKKEQGLKCRNVICFFWLSFYILMSFDISEGWLITDWPSDSLELWWYDNVMICVYTASKCLDNT